MSLRCSLLLAAVLAAPAAWAQSLPPDDRDIPADAQATEYADDAATSPLDTLIADMTRRPQTLINGATLEAWPAWLLRARSNRDARAIAQARWVLRQKTDGRYLAAVDALGGITPLGTGIPAKARAEAEALALETLRIPQPQSPGETPGLPERLGALGVDGNEYAQATGLTAVQEPRQLRYAGRDRYRRPLWLKDGAAQAWAAMQAAARAQGVVLEAVSGYRSQAYQQAIFARKRASGQKVANILKVNAAPGFSEHHGGCALDIGTPGSPPAEEVFEKTRAFAWLREHAGEFGFNMSYPRGNPHGIVYEPWHWCWRAAERG